MKKIISIAVILVSLLTGCTTQPETGDKLNIVTTYYAYQLAASQLGGDFVDVTSIYPPDSDAHSYELSPKQSIALQDADLVIITNQEEDSKIYDILKDRDNLLILESEEEHAAEADDHDEVHSHSHNWLSPDDMSDNIETITERLVELDDGNKATYQSNFTALNTELQTINDEYEAFGTSQTKPIVATHDAYETLTDEYGIKFTTLYGQHHDDEPTTKDILNAVDLVNNNDINTIFVEQDDTTNKVMHQIADETSVDIETIFTLETESSIKSFESITDFYNYNLEMMKLGQQ